MSKSKLLIGVIGLALLAPMQLSSSQIVGSYMEEPDNITRTKEIVIKKDINIEDFVSGHQEEIIEEVEEWIEVNIHISYYTDLLCENTNYGAVDAQGNKLVAGTIAIPRDIPLDTKFEIDGFDGEYIGRDRGSKKYIKWLSEDTMKIDMFVPRKKNETNSEYYKRVNNMGITKTKGRYLLPKE